MAAAVRRCPECGGAMETGFVLDTTYGVNAVARWVAGRPSRKWWLFGGADVRGRDCREVVSYRCGGCGLLREYATEPTKAPGILNS